jgi:predicted Zn-dependent peptidase
VRWIEHPILRERLCCQVLPGGLEFYALPKAGWQRQGALLAVDFGSLDLELVRGNGDEGQRTLPWGAAHFLEHRLFDKEYGDISPRFARLGAEVNAGTSFTSTTYAVSGTGPFADSVELLLDLVLDFHLSATGVERERQIIARELELFSDDLEWVSYLGALRALYGDHPLAMDMAGTRESLECIDLEVLETCHQTFYRPERMGLYLCGDFEMAPLLERVADRLERGRWRGRAEWQPRAREVVRSGAPQKQEWVLPVVQPHLVLAFADSQAGLQGAQLLERELALELALDMAFGAASDFYSQCYQDGLIDAESFGGEVCLEPFFGFCLVGGDTPYPQALGEALIERLRRVQEGKRLEEDFERARRRAYGQLVRGFEQVESCAGLLHGAVSSGADPFDYFEAYHRLDPGRVRQCLETCLDYRRPAWSRVLPLGD